MTTKEKRDIVFREIIKPAFKNAGYKTLGSNYYYAVREDCYIFVFVQNSQGNSPYLGYLFWLNINAISLEIPDKDLNKKYFPGGIRSDILLPDGGLLHPYFNAGGYRIDGYKDNQLQDMDIEDIKTQIGSDLQQYILPQLSQINTLSDWEERSEEWRQRLKQKRVLLLQYYGVAQVSNNTNESAIHLENTRNFCGLAPDEIREGKELYQQVKEHSSRPNDDKWNFILASLALGTQQ